jgi:hypothetical protein
MSGRVFWARKFKLPMIDWQFQVSCLGVVVFILLSEERPTSEIIDSMRPVCVMDILLVDGSILF